MKEFPRITIVMPSLNQFLYLEDLIGSDGVILGDGTMKKGNQRIKMINFRVAEFENLELS